MSNRTVVASLLILFVATRISYLILIDPAQLHAQAAEDELYRGTIALALTTGLEKPFIEYRADDYAGGSLVVGAMAAGFFLLLGPTAFSLKLVPVLIFTLSLYFWYQTIRRSSGDHVARTTGLLFCLSPPLFTGYSVTAMGYHSESFVFTAVSLHLVYRLWSEDQNPRWVPLLLGLTAGFGLWFTYTFAVTLLTLGLLLASSATQRLLKPLLTWGVLGFAVGFSPWILINLTNHFGGFVIGESSILGRFGLKFLLADLSFSSPLQIGLVQSVFTFASEDPRRPYRWTANLCYLVLFGGPLVAAALSVRPHWKSVFRRDDQPPPLALFAILYIVCFVLIVQFSDFRGARYRVPLQPFVFFLVALGVVGWQQRYPALARKIRYGFLSLVVVLGLATHAPLLSFDRPGHVFNVKGYQ